MTTADRERVVTRQAVQRQRRQVRTRDIHSTIYRQVRSQDKRVVTVGAVGHQACTVKIQRLASAQVGERNRQRIGQQ